MITLSVIDYSSSEMESSSDYTFSDYSSSEMESSNDTLSVFTPVQRWKVVMITLSVITPVVMLTLSVITPVQRW